MARRPHVGDPVVLRCNFAHAGALPGRLPIQEQGSRRRSSSEVALLGLRRGTPQGQPCSDAPGAADAAGGQLTDPDASRDMLAQRMLWACTRAARACLAFAALVFVDVVVVVVGGGASRRNSGSSSGPTERGGSAPPDRRARGVKQQREGRGLTVLGGDAPLARQAQCMQGEKGCQGLPMWGGYAPPARQAPCVSTEMGRSARRGAWHSPGRQWWWWWLVVFCLLLPCNATRIECQDWHRCDADPLHDSGGPGGENQKCRDQHRVEAGSDGAARQCTASPPNGGGRVVAELKERQAQHREGAAAEELMSCGGTGIAVQLLARPGISTESARPRPCRRSTRERSARWAALQGRHRRLRPYAGVRVGEAHQPGPQERRLRLLSANVTSWHSGAPGLRAAQAQAWLLQEARVSGQELPWAQRQFRDFGMQLHAGPEEPGTGQCLLAAAHKPGTCHMRHVDMQAPTGVDAHRLQHVLLHLGPGQVVHVVQCYGRAKGSVSQEHNAQLCMAAVTWLQGYGAVPCLVVGDLNMDLAKSGLAAPLAMAGWRDLLHDAGPTSIHSSGTATRIDYVLATDRPYRWWRLPPSAGTLAFRPMQFCKLNCG